MNCAKEARKLANFISEIDGSLPSYQPTNELKYTHFGALVTDIVLQAGVNYTTVVKPRIKNILLNYADYYTRIKFQALLEIEGLEKVVGWKHTTKLERISSILDYTTENGINTCYEFKAHLISLTNREKLLEINGVGPKTLDYLLKLLDFDTVAVDRHIYSFMAMANLEVKDYQTTKKVVEYAADFLQISRSSLDFSIWTYMSNKEYKKTEDSEQLVFEF